MTAYTEFVGPDAVNGAIKAMGLDTDRVLPLQGDGLVNAPAQTAGGPAVTNNGGPSDPSPV